MQSEESVAIVTDAGTGIGEALVESFAAAGARVVVGDIEAAGARPDGRPDRTTSAPRLLSTICRS